MNNNKKGASFIWPLRTAIRITSLFGEPRPDNRKHSGVDVAAPVGTPVYAMADGKIDSYWTDSVYGGGLSLRVSYPGDFTVGFAHLSKNNLLPTGAAVKKGDLIAYSGNTGTSSGPHLHITIRKFGNLVNPLDVLPKI